MHDLFAKYFNETISPKEKKELLELLANDADLKKEFLALQNLYAMSAFMPAADDASKAQPKWKQFKQKRNNNKTRYILKHAIGYAATIAVAVLATWMWISRPSEVAVEPLATYQELVTPPGQRAKITLPDGTTVWLNARSSLRYPSVFAKEERYVELNGEAYFDVEHNEEQPFVVSTEKLDIKVLGTEFNVHAYAGYSEFNASLIEGSIKIYNKGNEQNALTIAPHEQAELIENRLVKTAFTDMDFLLWRDGIYAFDDVTFTEIIQKLELYYDVTIDVTNRRVSSYKFTGKFRQRDGVESVLRTLQKVYYFGFVKDEETNIITIR